MSYASAPGPVRNVTVELRQGANNVTAVLSWQPPDEPNGVITQYQVFYAGYNGTQVYIYTFFCIAVCSQSARLQDILKCTIHCRSC